MKLFLLLIGLMFFFISCTSESRLDWRQETDYRWAEIDPGFLDHTGFHQLQPSETGIKALNLLSDGKIAENQNLLNGSGVAAGDVDGDGLVDLYFAMLGVPNKLYKNKGGFRFEDITESSGVAHSGVFSAGTVFEDIDGDYDLDLFITSLEGENALYLNDGQGNFQLSRNSGLGKGNGSTTMALADIDGDSDLDLYIAHYKEKTVKDLYNIEALVWENTVRRKNGTYALIPPFDQHFALIPGPNQPERRELGTKDELYINNGNGIFDRVEDTENRFRSSNGKKMGLKRDWGLTAKFQDLNADGLPDLYVCNDFWTPDRLWINEGGGRFREADPTVLRKQSFSSMGVDFSDINRDGFIDFFVTEMLSPHHRERMRQMITYTPFTEKLEDPGSQPQYMQNTLHLNRGDQTFAEIASYSGVEATGWSWATNFMDIDLDGFEDLVVNTGHAHDVLDLDTQQKLIQTSARNPGHLKGYILQYPPLKIANVALQNNGNLTFSNRSTDWGFEEEDISHGMSLADLDNDGDLDMITNRLNQEPAIFENRSTAKRIAVRLKGEKPNSRAIGAKIKLEGGPVIQQKEVAAGGAYLSGSDPLVVFAAEADRNHRLTISWPDGDKTVVDSIHYNRIYEIDENKSAIADKSVSKPVPEKQLPLFEDISERVKYLHYEQEFDDFDAQPLLPLKLSRLGPGIAWIDYDQDNDDDLLVGTGKGGKAGFFRNDGSGHFERVELGDISEKATGDQAGIIGWAEEGSTHILTGRSNYELDAYTGSPAVHYKLALEGSIPEIHKQELKGSYSTTGPLSASDYDGDGDLDLFIGGRFVPTQYPRDASSQLYLNEKGHFFPDTTNSLILNNVGLVTGSVFTDYDLDGDPDLLISTEWGSLKLFRNAQGVFKDITSLIGLDRYKGRWNGISTGDFNTDGWPDIVAANWGGNAMGALAPAYPLRVFYDDFDRDQRVEVIEAQYDQEMEGYVPLRRFDDLYRSLPAIARNLRSYKDFAGSHLSEMMGLPLQDLPSKLVNTVKHLVFLNEDKGKRFSAHPLPPESQLTAAFNPSIADFNNDGKEDIFLSQNLFSLPRNTPRLDAGRGIWLRGDGNGGFEVVNANRIGIKVYGEQRGAGVSDINLDGKIDLAIAQNKGSLKLYLNKTRHPGLSIRLAGPKANKEGIGSSVRLVYGDGIKGPRREIRAGSGYWSQNSKTQVLGMREFPDRIEVRWFDGTLQTVMAEPAKFRYEINYPL